MIVIFKKDYLKELYEQGVAKKRNTGSNLRLCDVIKTASISL